MNDPDTETRSDVFPKGMLYRMDALTDVCRPVVGGMFFSLRTGRVTSYPFQITDEQRRAVNKQRLKEHVARRDRHRRVRSAWLSFARAARAISQAALDLRSDDVRIVIDALRAEISSGRIDTAVIDNEGDRVAFAQAFNTGPAPTIVVRGPGPILSLALALFGIKCVAVENMYRDAESPPFALTLVDTELGPFTSVATYALLLDADDVAWLLSEASRFAYLGTDSVSSLP